jgi:hypothetical protein
MEMRFWGLETNKDRRAGWMFERLNAHDYWRSQMATSTAAANDGRHSPQMLTASRLHETIRQRRCSGATGKKTGG